MVGIVLLGVFVLLLALLYFSYSTPSELCGSWKDTAVISVPLLDLYLLFTVDAMELLKAKVLSW